MVLLYTFSNIFRYECLPLRDYEPVSVRDNETNTIVFNSLYKLKHGVSVFNELFFKCVFYIHQYVKKFKIYF